MPALFPWETRAAAKPFLDHFRAAEAQYGLPSGLLSRVAYQESRYNPNARSPAGAVGLMQFLPSTAGDFGLNPLDPVASIDAAGRYLAQLFSRFGNWTEALAAYNWGQGNVSRKGLDSAPTETRNYVAAISADVPGLRA